MDSFNDFFNLLFEASEKRFNDFAIENITSIHNIEEEAYLEKPTWLGGDNEFVCLFIDLDHSSKLSFKKHPETMAKVYDYFTQNVVAVLNRSDISADYIDIKGDGAFGIYEGENAVFKALAAALTFKTFFRKYIQSKFNGDFPEFNCKIGIHKDKILVKKIGVRGNNNEVWAGRVVNNAAKISNLSKKIREKEENIEETYIVISEKVRRELEKKPECGIFGCGHNLDGSSRGARNDVWKEFDTVNNEEVLDDKIYFTGAYWCKVGCDEMYLEKMLS